MKTATQILNEHLLPATAPNIHALEEYASEQCQKRDKLITACNDLIHEKMKPPKDQDSQLIIRLLLRRNKLENELKT